MRRFTLFVSCSASFAMEFDGRHCRSCTTYMKTARLTWGSVKRHCLLFRPANNTSIMDRPLSGNTLGNLTIILLNIKSHALHVEILLLLNYLRDPNACPIIFTQSFKDGNTSHLVSHLQHNHREIFQQVRATLEQRNEKKNFASKGLDITVFTSRSSYEKEVKYKVLKWIVNCFIPFSMVNNEDFRDMTTTINTKCPLFSRNSITQNLKNKVLRRKTYH